MSSSYLNAGFFLPQILAGRSQAWQLGAGWGGASPLLTGASGGGHSQGRAHIQRDRALTEGGLQR